MGSRMRIVVVCLFLMGFVSARAEPPAVFWPTPNGEYFETGDIIDSLQPTVSGRWESALYGCVRNDGNRFHEGSVGGLGHLTDCGSCICHPFGNGAILPEALTCLLKLTNHLQNGSSVVLPS